MDQSAGVTKISQLIIPPSMKSEVNPLSGYLNSGSIYYQKTVKGLFMCPENVEYLQNETISMITFPFFVENIVSKSEELYSGHRAYIENLMQQFKLNRQKVADLVACRIPIYKLPYPEENLQRGDISQLHNFNRTFILELSRNLILSPTMIIHDFYDTDPLTGIKDDPQWDYGSASYSDGTWHPEHLFINNPKNKRESYWVPGEVAFDTNPPDQPFHPRENYYSLNSRTGRSVYSGKGPGPGPGNKFMYTNYVDDGFKKSQGLFPRWRHPAQGLRLTKRNIDEGLRGGGRDDRRTVFVRKYDMSHLLAKSTY